MARILNDVIAALASFLTSAIALQCPPTLPDIGCDPDQNLHVVAFDSNMRTSTVYLAASAEANGFTNVAILGTGKSAEWGRGMQHKLNTYRNYVQDHVCECDIVLLIDAGDVLLVGGPVEVQDRFRALEEKWEVSLFFGGEVICREWHVPVCKKLEQLTADKGFARFLNSGLIVGRGRVLKSVFAEPITEAISHDQEWWRVYFLDHQDLGMGIDYNNDLFMVVAGVDGVFTGEWIDFMGQPPRAIGLEEVGDGRLAVVNKLTQTRPLVLHFPGPGKWQSWIPSDRSSAVALRGQGPLDDFWHFVRGDIESCTLHELFVRFFPAQAATLGIPRLDESYVRLGDYRALLTLPGHRPFCGGLDNTSPWKAFDRVFGTARILLILCACLCVWATTLMWILVISCNLGWFTKRMPWLVGSIPAWLIGRMKRCEERVADVEMKVL